MKQRDS